MHTLYKIYILGLKINHTYVNLQNNILRETKKLLKQKNPVNLKKIIS